jgi:hypothetical protein
MMNGADWMRRHRLEFTASPMRAEMMGISSLKRSLSIE